MSNNYIADICLDTVSNISRQLPLQDDIRSILYAIKQICPPIIDFQRINLIIFSSLQDNYTLYILDGHDDEILISEIYITPGHEQFEFWSQPAVQEYNGADFMRVFPEITNFEQYRNAVDCARLRLSVQGILRGAIEFVKIDGNIFDSEMLVFFKMIADLAASNLAGILKTESMQREKAGILREKEHLEILVDVTNTAISTLEMDEMVNEVAENISKFFGIRTFALMLLDTEQNRNSFKFHPSCWLADSLHINNKLSYSLEGSQLQKIIESSRACVLTRERIARISRNEPVLSLILNDSNKAVCLFPLNFGPRCLGVMALAHEHPDIFTQESMELLGQIASRVAIAVHNALEYQKIITQKEDVTQENVYLSDQIQEFDSFGEIVGKSDAIRRVLEQVEIVAPSDSSVLIFGETGTGKELFARAIHNRSQRRKQRMIKMNCASIPIGLLESELFGHEKGAFTGALALRKGRFELANRSTLMLDEIGDMPLALQPKLLRVLQEREIERLGSSEVIPVDVRVVAATNRNLRQMVTAGEYRPDLFYRLNVFPITIPPLRDRREDILPLAGFFTKKVAKMMNRNIENISADALKSLYEHDWPGNIRELANVIERAVILSSGTTLNLHPLETHPVEPAPERGELLKDPPAASTYLSRHPQPGENAKERDRIIAALAESNGIVAGPRGAAVKLGLKRTTLLSRMQRMDITVHDINRRYVKI
ncbi:MAG: sigma 54-interacting transcriptional regulator [Deltaproteobacteria bacterium]|jgi:formate hydrogenlyase transcriptional activator|nr:sigma 54-interacting transcriptional regulator [Deltaproteobacteria bacterium]